MKLAVLDLHRLISSKTYESVKIAGVLKDYFDGEVDVFEMIRNIPPDINIEEYDGLLVSGSDSTHIEKYRGYKITVNIIEEAQKKSVPVLGICAGSQMVAKMHGLNIEFMDKPEMGWYEIELSEEGKKDRLLKGLPEKFISFECHIKRIYEGDLDTKNVTILAKSKNCIQAARYENNVWGVQFHVEDTIEDGNKQISGYTRREPSSLSRIDSPVELVGRNVYKNFVEIAKEEAGL